MTPQEREEIRRMIVQAVADATKELRDDVAENARSLDTLRGRVTSTDKQIGKLFATDRRHSDEHDAVTAEVAATETRLNTRMQATVERIDVTLQDIVKQIKEGRTPGDVRASEAKTAAICASEAAVLTNQKASSLVTATNAIATATTAAAVDADLAKQEAVKTKRLSVTQLVAFVIAVALLVAQHLFGK